MSKGSANTEMEALKKALNEYLDGTEGDGTESAEHLANALMGAQGKSWEETEEDVQKDLLAAFIMAVKNKEVSLREAFLERRAEVLNAVDNGWTSLGIFIQNGNVEAVKFLIDKGAGSIQEELDAAYQICCEAFQEDTELLGKMAQQIERRPRKLEVIHEEHSDTFPEELPTASQEDKSGWVAISNDILRVLPGVAQTPQTPQTPQTNSARQRQVQATERGMRATFQKARVDNLKRQLVREDRKKATTNQEAIATAWRIWNDPQVKEGYPELFLSQEQLATARRGLSAADPLGAQVAQTEIKLTGEKEVDAALIESRKEAESKSAPKTHDLLKKNTAQIIEMVGEIVTKFQRGEELSPEHKETLERIQIALDGSGISSFCRFFLCLVDKVAARNLTKKSNLSTGPVHGDGNCFFHALEGVELTMADDREIKFDPIAPLRRVMVLTDLQTPEHAETVLDENPARFFEAPEVTSYLRVTGRNDVKMYNEAGMDIAVLQEGRMPAQKCTHIAQIGSGGTAHFEEIPEGNIGAHIKHAQAQRPPASAAAKASVGKPSSAAKSALLPKVLFVFDFDKTVTNEHAWNTVMQTCRRPAMGVKEAEVKNVIRPMISDLEQWRRALRLMKQNNIPFIFCSNGADKRFATIWCDLIFEGEQDATEIKGWFSRQAHKFVGPYEGSGDHKSTPQLKWEGCNNCWTQDGEKVDGIKSITEKYPGYEICFVDDVAENIDYMTQEGRLKKTNVHQQIDPGVCPMWIYGKMVEHGVSQAAQCAIQAMKARYAKLQEDAAVPEQNFWQDYLVLACSLGEQGKEALQELIPESQKLPANANISGEGRSQKESTEQALGNVSQEAVRILHATLAPQRHAIDYFLRASNPENKALPRLFAIYAKLGEDVVTQGTPLHKMLVMEGMDGKWYLYGDGSVGYDSVDALVKGYVEQKINSHKQTINIRKVNPVDCSGDEETLANGATAIDAILNAAEAGEEQAVEKARIVRLLAEHLALGVSRKAVPETRSSGGELITDWSEMSLVVNEMWFRVKSREEGGRGFICEYAIDDPPQKVPSQRRYSCQIGDNGGVTGCIDKIVKMIKFRSDERARATPLTVVETGRLRDYFTQAVGAVGAASANYGTVGGPSREDKKEAPQVPRPPASAAAKAPEQKSPAPAAASGKACRFATTPEEQKEACQKLRSIEKNEDIEGVLAAMTVFPREDYGIFFNDEKLAPLLLERMAEGGLIKEGMEKNSNGYNILYQHQQHIWLPKKFENVLSIATVFFKYMPRPGRGKLGELFNERAKTKEEKEKCKQLFGPLLLVALAETTGMIPLDRGGVQLTLAENSPELIAQEILDDGFAPNTTNAQNENALHIACRNPNIEEKIIAKLLELGVDPKAKNADGTPPLDCMPERDPRRAKVAEIFAAHEQKKVEQKSPKPEQNGRREAAPGAEEPQGKESLEAAISGYNEAETEEEQRNAGNKLIEALKEAKDAEVKAQTQTLKKALENAVGDDLTEVALAILERCPKAWDWNFAAEDYRPINIFEMAVYNGKWAVVERLARFKNRRFDPEALGEAINALCIEEELEESNKTKTLEVLVNAKCISEEQALAWVEKITPAPQNKEAVQNAIKAAAPQKAASAKEPEPERKAHDAAKEDSSLKGVLEAYAGQEGNTEALINALQAILEKAVERNEVAVVQAFLRSEQTKGLVWVKIDGKGCNALELAVSLGHYGIVRCLAEQEEKTTDVEILQEAVSALISGDSKTKAETLEALVKGNCISGNEVLQLIKANKENQEANQTELAALEAKVEAAVSELETPHVVQDVLNEMLEQVEKQQQQALQLHPLADLRLINPNLLNALLQAGAISLPQRKGEAELVRVTGAHVTPEWNPEWTWSREGESFTLKKVGTNEGFTFTGDQYRNLDAALTRQKQQAHTTISRAIRKTECTASLIKNALEPIFVKEEKTDPLKYKNEQGATLLHEAAEAGAPEAIKELIDAGADIEAKDQKGFAPIEVALLAFRTGTPHAMQCLGVLLEKTKRPEEEPGAVSSEEEERAHQENFRMGRIAKALQKISETEQQEAQERIKELEAELEELRSQPVQGDGAGVQEDIARLQATIEEVKQEMERAVQLAETLKRRSGEKDQLIADLEGRLEAQKKQIDQKNHESRDAINQASEELKALQDMVRALGGKQPYQEKDGDENAPRDPDAEEEPGTPKEDGLAEEKAALEEIAQRLGAQLAVAARATEALQAQQAELTAELAAAAAKKAQAEQAVRGVQEKERELDEQKAALEQKAREAEEKVVTANAERDAAQRELEEAKNASEDKKNGAPTAEEIAKLQQRVNTAEAEALQAKQEAKDAEDKKQEAEQKAASLKTQNAQLIGKKGRAEATVQQLQEQLDDLNKKKGELDRNLQQAKKAKETAESERDRLQQQLDGKEKELKQAKEGADAERKDHEKALQKQKEAAEKEKKDAVKKAKEEEKKELKDREEKVKAREEKIDPKKEKEMKDREEKFERAQEKFNRNKASQKDARERLEQKLAEEKEAKQAEQKQKQTLAQELADLKAERKKEGDAASKQTKDLADLKQEKAAADQKLQEEKKQRDEEKKSWEEKLDALKKKPAEQQGKNDNKPPVDPNAALRSQKASEIARESGKLADLQKKKAATIERRDAAKARSTKAKAALEALSPYIPDEKGKTEASALPSAPVAGGSVVGAVGGGVGLTIAGLSTALSVALPILLPVLVLVGAYMLYDKKRSEAAGLQTTVKQGDAEAKEAETEISNLGNEIKAAEQNLTNAQAALTAIPPAPTLPAPTTPAQGQGR